jgi:hypothetical protein
MSPYDQTRSHFDLDWQRGRQGELFVESLRNALALKNSSIEVKTDAYFFSGRAEKFASQRLYIEMEARGKDGTWRKSGLQTTKAELWFFVFGRHPGGMVFETAWLRKAVTKAAEHPANAATCDYGENPTRGFYVYLRHFVLARDAALDEH